MPHPCFYTGRMLNLETSLLKILQEIEGFEHFSAPVATLETSIVFKYISIVGKSKHTFVCHE